LSHDTILHRVLRPAVGRLAATSVTPDSLTALRLSTGLGAAFCFACGSGYLAAGAGLFLVSMLLDRADGELARQSGRFSRIGGRFDLVSDCLATMAAFVGLGIGAAPDWMAPGTGYALGIVAAMSTAALFAQLNMLPPAEGIAGGPARSRRFDPDDVMLVVPIAIWCGAAPWILLASGILTPIAAVLVGGLRVTARKRTARLAKVG
jgi:phosphatidylglycerophosphate synthase